jgi:hypothetical protein
MRNANAGTGPLRSQKFRFLVDKGADGQRVWWGTPITDPNFDPNFNGLFLDPNNV